MKYRALVRVLTGCNIKCRHCYVSANDFKNEQFSYDQLKTVIDRLADFGVDSIIFTGGQPTLAGKDLIDSISYASYKRAETGYPKRIEVTTNSSIGRDRKTADYWISSMKRAGLDRIRLSADEYHREFLPKEFEDLVMEVAKENDMQVKIMEVVSPNNRIDSNIETEDRKTFALRPGGRAFSEDLRQGWDNTPSCRIHQSYSRKKEETSIFIHPTGDVYTCNVGAAKELSLGNMLVDDLDEILYGKKSGVLGALAEGDVAGLGKSLKYSGEETKLIIGAYGRCGACCKMREAMKSLPDKAEVGHWG